MKQHLHNTLRLLAMAAALFLSLSAVAFAQEITGSISGTVKDSVGAAVKGATVTITDSEKKVVVRTVTFGTPVDSEMCFMWVYYFDR